MAAVVTLRPKACVFAVPTVDITRSSSTYALRMALATIRLASGLERRIHRLGVFRGKRDFHVLFTKLFMHEGDSVIARRHTLDFKLAIRSGDRIERALGYVNEHAHPRVLVALHGQHNLFAGEGFLD